MRVVVVTRLLHPFIILAKSDRPSITLTVVMTPSFSILVEMSQPTIHDDNDGAKFFGIIHFSDLRGRIKITLRRVTLLEKKKPPTHKF